MSVGMSGHQTRGETQQEWLTPPWLLAALGHFDLDPCASSLLPFKTADTHYQLPTDGLSEPWFGRVWCNPPYGRETGKWLNRLATHGNGIALIFARTETRMFFSEVWERADAIFFIEKRIAFYTPDGVPAKYTGGAPSCLVAYGKNNADALYEADIPGMFIDL